MFRKLSVILVIALIAFTAACSSKSSSGSTAAAAGAGPVAGVAATATPASCPTKNTEAFAKTRFVADVALAGGAFKRYIYTPAKAGKFQKGAKGKVTALIKAAAAGAFVINRLDAAKNAAQANPTLCKVLARPIAGFGAAVSGLVAKARSGLGTINPTDVTSGGNLLTDLHNAASQGGAPFTDNQNTSA